MALGALIVLWPKNLKSRHFLVDFSAYGKSEAEEEGIYKSIAKAYGPCNYIPRRKFKRATEYDKALEDALAKIRWMETEDYPQVK
jgi:hypothetical protein